MPETLAICPGTFDPPTDGHVGIITRSLRLFDRVIVAVTINLSKQPMFTAQERTELIRECFPDDPRVQIEQLDGLLAAYARSRGAVAIVRGLRAPSDFEYELKMAQMNRHLDPDLDTVFLATEAEETYVSSSLVKEVASLGGDIRDLVPPHVYAALSAKLAARRDAS